MYAEPYGLQENPFSMTMDPRYFVLTSSHREALATLIYAIEQKEGWALLMGQAGVGKTISIAGLLRQLGDEVAPATVSFQGVSSALEMFNRMALQMGLQDGPFRRKMDFIGALREQIQYCREEGKTLLLLLDDVQLAAPGLLEEVSLLGNADDGHPRVLNIFLIARPELAYLMDQDHLDDLKQRLRRFSRLEPLGRDETGFYLRERLKIAGREDELFDDQALDAIYEASLGVPRRVNALAALSLKNGLKDGVDIIGRDQVMASVERMGDLGTELDDAFTAAHPALPPQDQTCPLGVPLPTLTPGEADFEEKMDESRNRLYRGMKWWQRTVKFTVEWDRMRRRRLGLLATEFPNFCSRWDLPFWDDFNEARRQADQAGARYEDWIGCQFQRVVGQGFGRISPADLHGSEAVRCYEQAQAETEVEAGTQAADSGPAAPASAGMIDDSKALDMMRELLDLSQYVCDGQTRHPEDLLAEAVCQAVLPLKALENHPEIRPRVERALARRRSSLPGASTGESSHPSVII